MQNTKEQATLHFAIIPTKKKGLYTALCFELGLVMEGDDIFKLKARIEKAARNYFLTIAEDSELGDELLNQSLPKKYAPILEKIKALSCRHMVSLKSREIFARSRVCTKAGTG